MSTQKCVERVGIDRLVRSLKRLGKSARDNGAQDSLIVKEHSSCVHGDNPREAMALKAH